MYIYGISKWVIENTHLRWLNIIVINPFQQKIVFLSFLWCDSVYAMLLEIVITRKFLSWWRVTLRNGYLKTLI